MNQIIISPALGLITPRLFTPTPKAAQRVLEFFTAQINNDHTRKAYLNATRRFSDWCEAHGPTDLAAVQPFHVAAFIKQLQGEVSPPTVKQTLAALRMLFDWLVTGHIIEVNPAHAVRGPKYVVKKGKTSVLDASGPPRAARRSVDTYQGSENSRDRPRIDLRTAPGRAAHSEMTLYPLDSNVLIRAHEDYYPVDRIP